VAADRTEELDENTMQLSTCGNSSYFLAEEISMGADRLYKGFILYFIIAIDLYLLFGIILGLKYDKQKNSRVANSDDDKIFRKNQKADDISITTNNLTTDPTTQTDIHHTIASGTAVSFCTGLNLKHRLVYVFSADHPELPRFTRALLNVAGFSWILVMCALINWLTSSAIGIVFAIVVSFLVVRGWTLVGEKVMKTARTLGIVLSVLSIVVCHVVSIIGSIEMSNDSFTHFTVSFLVTYLVIEMLIWEFGSYIVQKGIASKKNEAKRHWVTPALWKAFN
jgi:hypothetical protein